MEKSVLDWVVLVLVIVGGLNWGLMAINRGWNVVESLLGAWPILVQIVYGLVGLAALYMIYMTFKD
ncbi:DUF378 domain-containing protein [Candidatus Pacearchaeota archaeon]|nr:DUF378 domain-containing protein [Candidatus Pacearchaeota archaeon]